MDKPQSTQALLELALWFGVLAGLVGLAFYVIVKLRRSAHDAAPGANAMMTNFRELHARGELTDEEYRKLKTSLTARLQAELKERGNTDEPS